MIILAVIVVIGVLSAKKRFAGKGGCCGGGGGSIEDEKKLDGPVTGKKIVHIEGMHCENCKIRVERAINKIDGASAKVNLKKNIAVVETDREVSDDLIKKAVEDQDYTVILIEDKAVK